MASNEFLEILNNVDTQIHQLLLFILRDPQLRAATRKKLDIGKLSGMTLDSDLLVSKLTLFGLLLELDMTTPSSDDEIEEFKRTITPHVVEYLLQLMDICDERLLAETLLLQVHLFAAFVPNGVIQEGLKEEPSSSGVLLQLLLKLLQVSNTAPASYAQQAAVQLSPVGTAAVDTDLPYRLLRIVFLPSPFNVMNSKIKLVSVLTHTLDNLSLPEQGYQLLLEQLEQLCNSILEHSKTHTTSKEDNLSTIQDEEAPKDLGTFKTVGLALLENVATENRLPRFNFGLLLTSSTADPGKSTGSTEEGELLLPSAANWQYAKLFQTVIQLVAVVPHHCPALCTATWPTLLHKALTDRGLSTLVVISFATLLVSHTKHTSKFIEQCMHRKLHTALLVCSRGFAHNNASPHPEHITAGQVQTPRTASTFDALSALCEALCSLLLSKGSLAVDLVGDSTQQPISALIPFLHYPNLVLRVPHTGNTVAAEEPSALLCTMLDIFGQLLEHLGKAEAGGVHGRLWKAVCHIIEQLPIKQEAGTVTIDDKTTEVALKCFILLCLLVQDISKHDKELLWDLCDSICDANICKLKNCSNADVVHQLQLFTNSLYLAVDEKQGQSLVTRGICDTVHNNTAEQTNQLAVSVSVFERQHQVGLEDIVQQEHSAWNVITRLCVEEVQATIRSYITNEQVKHRNKVVMDGIGTFQTTNRNIIEMQEAAAFAALSNWLSEDTQSTSRLVLERQAVADKEMFYQVAQAEVQGEAQYAAANLALQVSEEFDRHTIRTTEENDRKDHIYQAAIQRQHLIFRGHMILESRKRGLLMSKEATDRMVIVTALLELQAHFGYVNVINSEKAVRHQLQIWLLEDRAVVVKQEFKAEYQWKLLPSLYHRRDLLLEEHKETIERTMVRNKELYATSVFHLDMAQLEEECRRRDLQSQSDVAINALHVYLVSMGLCEDQRHSRFEIEWAEEKQREVILRAHEAHTPIILETEELNIRNAFVTTCVSELNALIHFCREVIYMVDMEIGHRQSAQKYEQEAWQIVQQRNMLSIEAVNRTRLNTLQACTRDMLMLEKSEQDDRDYIVQQQEEWRFMTQSSVTQQAESVTRASYSNEAVVSFRLLAIQHREEKDRIDMTNTTITQFNIMLKYLIAEQEQLSRNTLLTAWASPLPRVKLHLQMMQCEWKETHYRKMLRWEQIIQRNGITNPPMYEEHKQRIRSIVNVETGQRSKLMRREVTLFTETAFLFCMGSWLHIRQQLVDTEADQWNALVSFHNEQLDSIHHEMDISATVLINGNKLTFKCPCCRHTLTLHQAFLDCLIERRAKEAAAQQHIEQMVHTYTNNGPAQFLKKRPQNQPAPKKGPQPNRINNTDSKIKQPNNTHNNVSNKPHNASNIPNNNHNANNNNHNLTNANELKHPNNSNNSTTATTVGNYADNNEAMNIANGNHNNSTVNTSDSGSGGAYKIGNDDSGNDNDNCDNVGVGERDQTSVCMSTQTDPSYFEFMPQHETTNDQLLPNNQGVWSSPTGMERRSSSSSNGIHPATLSEWGGIDPPSPPNSAPTSTTHSNHKPPPTGKHPPISNNHVWSGPPPPQSQPPPTTTSKPLGDTTSISQTQQQQQQQQQTAHIIPNKGLPPIQRGIPAAAAGGAPFVYEVKKKTSKGRLGSHNKGPGQGNNKQLSLHEPHNHNSSNVNAHMTQEQQHMTQASLALQKHYDQLGTEIDKQQKQRINRRSPKKQQQHTGVQSRRKTDEGETSQDEDEENLLLYFVERKRQLEALTHTGDTTTRKVPNKKTKAADLEDIGLPPAIVGALLDADPLSQKSALSKRTTGTTWLHASSQQAAHKPKQGIFGAGSLEGIAGFDANLYRGVGGTTGVT